MPDPKIGGSRFGTHGRLPQAAGLWVCPTCRTENPGTVDDGCQNPECPTVQAPPQRSAQPDAPVAAGILRVLPGGAMAEAFAQWRAENSSRPLNLQQAWEAGWIAGITWHTVHVLPPPEAAPMTDPGMPEPVFTRAKETLVLIVHDVDQSQTRVVDDATLATVVAALRFYEENDLRYGSKPGQLSSAQVKALVARLSPDEENPL